MSAYREGFGAELRQRAEAAQIAELVDKRAPYLQDLLAQRNARIIGGGVGTLGALATATALLVESQGPAPVLLLYSSIAASLVAYALARRLRTALPSGWPLDEAPRARREGWSVGLPLVAAAFLMPLAIHGLVYLPVGALFGKDVLLDFSRWMFASGVLVGHAHAALAILSALFARKLARTPSAMLDGDAVRKSWLPALAITVAVSAVPGILFLGVPPILCAVTGLVFVPATFRAARRVVIRERIAFDEAERAAAHVRVGIEDLERARDEVLEEPAVRESRSSA